MCFTHHTKRKLVAQYLVYVSGNLDINALRVDVLEKFVLAKDELGKKLFPKATRYITYKRDKPVWIEEENFDIKDHVFAWSQPRKEEELKTLVENLFSKPLPLDKALWQFIQVPLTTPGKSCLFFRVHHGIGDGVAMVNFFSQQFGTKSEEENIKVNSSSFAFQNQMWTVLKVLFTGPYRVLNVFARSPDRNILHGAEHSGDKSIAWSKSVDLDLIKRIRTAAGGTVNDVILTCLAGSVRDCLKMHSTAFPRSVDISFGVSLRKPREKIVLDNQSAGMIFNLPTHTDNIAELFKETKSRMDKLKKSGDHYTHLITTTICTKFLPGYLLGLVLSSYSSKNTLLYSYVPGLLRKMALAGVPVEKVIAMSPALKTTGRFTQNS